MRIRVRSKGLLVVAVAFGGLTLALPHGAQAEPGAATPGSAGIDTALPLTDSAVTVNGRGAYADLAITVNQTELLTNQSVSVTWTGGEPTITGPGRFSGNFLQIMQCWGDDDGTNPDNPGPPPEQCVQGAVAGTYGGPDTAIFPQTLAVSRIIWRSNWPGYDPTIGVKDPSSVSVYRAFRAVDGTEVGVQADANFNPSVGGGNYWLNPYFDIVTTNEIAGASTAADGTGAELFQLNTGLQSSGLGCGQSVQPVEGGGTKTPTCWLVIVPRGTPAAENAGTPFEVDAEQYGVATSPLSPSSWRNRIAIPLEFNPVDSPCTFSDIERRIAGSELALPAVASWQPALCADTDRPPFSYAPVSDSAARALLAASTDGGPGMIAVSRPLNAASTDPASPAVYAPLTASGLVIGFNIERLPALDAPDEEKRLAGIRVATLNLTPRLVAKLLTQSYRGQVTIYDAPDYGWLPTNPAHLAADPDFIRFNPEFSLLAAGDSRTFSGLQLPAGNSDAALQVWEWILADDEARAWLGGAADEWGMRVNPAYSTDATGNPTGLPFASPLPNTFPKAEPYCYEAEPFGPDNSIIPPPLCGTDWMPYARSFADAATVARNAFDGARIIQNRFALAAGDVWKRITPQSIGQRSMLALTDTPSAAQFGLQVARLSRADDNGANRSFIAPDAAGLTAGVATMAARDVPGFLEPNPEATAPAAYPLTSITYAAVKPLSLDAAARSDFADFIDYARAAGQVPGLSYGQLPRGYVPLPSALKTAASAAAAAVRTLVAPTTTTTTTPAPPDWSGGGGGGTTDTIGSVDTATTVVESPTTSTTVDEPAPATTEASPGAPTPATPPPPTRHAVPVLAGMALFSALGALEITKRPRRATQATIPDEQTDG